MPEFDPSSYPPFPSSPSYPCVSLSTISLSALESHSPTEESRAFEAFKTRGFIYLDLSSSPNGEAILHGSETIGRIAEETFSLPLDEKLKYLPASKDLFGYKRAGATKADPSGARDTAEFFNVSKNDMLKPPSEMDRKWPEVILKEQEVFARYCRAAHTVGMDLVRMLGRRLGIEEEELVKRHRIDLPSGDHIRLTRGPARKDPKMPEIQTPSHTDFGTITILMNWLGGLQVWSESARSMGPLEPDTPGEWVWVKPKKGCAIVNLGDAAVRFTNGVLCSGRHRVTPAPEKQGLYTRYSIVYFVRPNDDAVLQVLEGEHVPKAEKDEEAVPAKEWIYRQTAALGNNTLDN
ncbi:Clavaminate synthase-like protein [Piedraia hortae CBS 480.64]|uniref:Clavaminate synthase-like protein n=1 Tax=Piedraia hortae CBS 480.64 TaxID=1314780 RepID=A0A6A7BQ28_9PEZI|nr:Clavaminate synthase-like protein [Piedraia hortae CBS 480.64]